MYRYPRTYILLLLVLCMFLFSCNTMNTSNNNSEHIIRLGMTSPLTGAPAESGIALKQGAELAVQELNSEGVLIDGNIYEIQLFVEDNEAKPEVGVSAAEKLITQNNVHYLIGDAILSSVTMAIMELAPKHNIPIVSGESVSEAIIEKVQENPERYQYYWKMNFGSSAYASTVFHTVSWLSETNNFEPKTKRVFFVVEDTDYGRSNAEVASDLFENIGWQTSSIETVPMGHTDFYPILNKLREDEADVLISVFTPLSSGVALVKQFSELELETLHIAIYYPSQPDFVSQTGDASNGLLWSPLIFDPNTIESHQQFAQKISDMFNAEATLDHAYGYDAIFNAIDSIKRANSLVPEDIIDAVADLNRQGVVGKYVFDQNTHQGKAGIDFIPILTAQIQDGTNYVIWPEELSTGNYLVQPWLNK